MSTPETEQIPYTRDFVVDAEYQTALTRALYLQAFRSPAVWAILGGFFLVFLGLAVLNPSQWWVLIFWVGVMVVVYGLRYARTHRVIRTAFPAGKVIRIGFGPTHFAISDGADASVLAYSGFDEIEVRGSVVWLRRTTPKRRMAYPRALFPEAELDRIRAGYAGPKSPMG